jgi:repressor LexA
MFGTRLRKLRKQQHLTMKELGRKFNLAESTISGYENGNRTPDLSIVQQFADFFGTSVDHLVGRDPISKEAAEAYIINRTISIPVFETIYPTSSLEPSHDTTNFEVIGSDILQGRKGFVLIVSDDSMTGDHVFPNDRAIVVVQENISRSDIALVAVDRKQATLKRVKFQGDLCILSSSNPKIEPMILPFDRVHVIGKVIEFRRNLESN